MLIRGLTQTNNMPTINCALLVDLEGRKRTTREGEKVYLNYEGKQIEAEERVPTYDEEKGQFKTRLMGWKDFEEEAQEMTERARKFWRVNKGESEEKWRKTPWYRFRDAKSAEEVEIRPEEAYIIGTLETNAANARGWSYYYGRGFNEQVEAIGRLRKAKKFNEKYNLFETGGSDAHTNKEIGNGYTLINDVNDFSLDTIRKNMVAKRSQSMGKLSSPLVHAITVMNKIKKGLYF